MGRRGGRRRGEEGAGGRRRGAGGNPKFTILQLGVIEVTTMTTELFFPTTTAEAVVVKQQRQEQQTQQPEEELVVVKSKRNPKNVMRGFHSRDEIDICAQILEIVARQDLMSLDRVRTRHFVRGDHHHGIEINRDGIVSVNFIRRLIQISEKVLHLYVDRLVTHGLMEVHNFSIKRNSIKKIPIITDKGRQFLQVYREIKSMLTALFD